MLWHKALVAPLCGAGFWHLYSYICPWPLGDMGASVLEHTASSGPQTIVPAQLPGTAGAKPSCVGFWWSPLITISGQVSSINIGWDPLSTHAPLDNKTAFSFHTNTDHSSANALFVLFGVFRQCWQLHIVLSVVICEDYIWSIWRSHRQTHTHISNLRENVKGLIQQTAEKEQSNRSVYAFPRAAPNHRMPCSSLWSANVPVREPKIMRQ